MRGSREGFALAVVLLVSLVALGAVVGAAFLAVTSARQVAVGERRATTALLVAESGLNTLVARGAAPAYAYDSDVDATVADWLTRTGLDSYDIVTTDGTDVGTVNLTALNEDATAGTVTIRSEGVSPDDSRRVVLQTYELRQAIRDSGPGLFANAALITQERLDTNSAKSNLIGRGDTVDDWTFGDRVISESQPGDYFETEDGTLYRVGSLREDGDYDVTPINPVGAMTTLPGNEPGTLVPYAVAEEDGLSAPYGDTFAVSGSYLYEEGTEIRLGEFGRATVESVDGEAGTITVSWTTLPTEATLAEGTPIRTVIPSAITENGNCPTGPNIDSKLPQGCEIEDLSNVFEKVFGDCDQRCLYEIANGTYEPAEGEAVPSGAYYGPTTTDSWPEGGQVTGVTWIDGAQTGDFNSRGKGSKSSDEGALCGDGVVVLNTGTYDTEGEDFDGQNSTINLNVSGCDFKGILYVVGDLGIQGNLESFSGTIIVQTESGTQVQGGGRGPGGAEKAVYDPIAIRNALAGIPRGGSNVSDGLLGPIRASFRFGR